MQNQRSRTCSAATSVCLAFMGGDFTLSKPGPQGCASHGDSAEGSPKEWGRGETNRLEILSRPAYRICGALGPISTSWPGHKGLGKEPGLQEEVSVGIRAFGMGGITMPPKDLCIFSSAQCKYCLEICTCEGEGSKPGPWKRDSHCTFSSW